MSNRGAISRVLFVILVLAMYAGSLVYAYSERERRSLHLQEDVRDKDQVHLMVRIVQANPAASEITARLSFLLSGKIAKDAVTPVVDVRVILNSARGPQHFDFPKGRRINPIVAVFLLDGNVNRYPIDRHRADIWVIMTTPNWASQSQPRPSDAATEPNIPAEMSGKLELGTA